MAIILLLATCVTHYHQSSILDTNFIRTDASVLTVKIAFASGAVRLSIDTARLKLSNLLHVSLDHIAFFYDIYILYIHICV